MSTAEERQTGRDRKQTERQRTAGWRRNKDESSGRKTAGGRRLWFHTIRFQGYSFFGGGVSSAVLQELLTARRGETRGRVSFNNKGRRRMGEMRTLARLNDRNKTERGGETEKNMTRNDRDGK